MQHYFAHTHTHMSKDIKAKAKERSLISVEQRSNVALHVDWKVFSFRSDANLRSMKC